MCQEDMFGCLLFVRGFSRGSNVDGSYLCVMSKLSVFWREKKEKRMNLFLLSVIQANVNPFFSHAEFLTQKINFLFFELLLLKKRIDFF
jgi:hypothetical protein